LSEQQRIQRLVLCKLARRQLRYLARISYERVVDPHTGQLMWFSLASRQCFADKPRALREVDVKDAPLLPWSLRVRQKDRRALWYHAGSGIWSSTKPDGWRSCRRCRRNLAVRTCEASACRGAELCFSCYRDWHLMLPLVRASRGDHDGVATEIVHCYKCDQLADRHCADCGTDTCKSCFARIHRSPLLAVHTFSPL
jgi:hypothetical protein